MADATIVVLVAGAVGTLLMVGFVGYVQLQRVTRAYGEATRILERTRSRYGELAEQQPVSRRELARVGEAMDTLREQRDGRRRT